MLSLSEVYHQPFLRYRRLDHIGESRFRTNSECLVAANRQTNWMLFTHIWTKFDTLNRMRPLSEVYHQPFLRYRRRKNPEFRTNSECLVAANRQTNWMLFTHIWTKFDTLNRMRPIAVSYIEPSSSYQNPDFAEKNCWSRKISNYANLKFFALSRLVKIRRVRYWNDRLRTSSRFGDTSHFLRNPDNPDRLPAADRHAN